jgi:hypothetical protein
MAAFDDESASVTEHLLKQESSPSSSSSSSIDLEEARLCTMRSSSKGGIWRTIWHHRISICVHLGIFITYTVALSLLLQRTYRLTRQGPDLVNCNSP